MAVCMMLIHRHGSRDLLTGIIIILTNAQDSGFEHCNQYELPSTRGAHLKLENPQLGAEPMLKRMQARGDDRMVSLESSYVSLKSSSSSAVSKFGALCNVLLLLVKLSVLSCPRVFSQFRPFVERPPFWLHQPPRPGKSPGL
ncbi:hypothetical protein PM082_001971 [Marasmius tenuissimus]|nr:hypothetical protein PM082_001971 [Marasmius tenuissimus]